MSIRRQDLALACAGALAIVVVVLRARIQAITIDEADTYLLWAGPAWPGHWWFNSNNHVLNSMLMRGATTILGTSVFTVRLPAVFGAVLYLSAALVLVRMLANSDTLRLVLFACLAFNPLILDHLVAARGYSLAVGFLMCAIAAPVWAFVRGRPMWGPCALASLCAGLSFAANFSFAFVDASAMAAIFVWAAVRERSWGVRAGRLLPACLLPGTAAAFAVCGSVLRDYTKRELVAGAASWRESFGSVVNASLYEPNPFLLNPILLHFAERVRGMVLPLVAAAFVLAAVAAVVTRRRVKDTRPAEAAVVLAAVLAGALALHWVAFRAAGVLLPKARTGLFMAPLFLLAGGGALAAAPRLFRRAGIAALALMAVYFLGCLRLTYFQEWKYDADIDEAYAVLAYYNHVYGVKDPAAFWMYTSSLNFYRRLSGREDMEAFPRGAWLPYPPGRRVYLLHSVLDAAFLEKEKLDVVWRAPRTEAVVAVRPGLAPLACPAVPGVRVPGTMMQKHIE